MDGKRIKISFDPWTKVRLSKEETGKNPKAQNNWYCTKKKGGCGNVVNSTHLVCDCKAWRCATCDDLHAPDQGNCGRCGLSQSWNPASSLVWQGCSFGETFVEFLTQLPYPSRDYKAVKSEFCLSEAVVVKRVKLATQVSQPAVTVKRVKLAGLRYNGQGQVPTQLLPSPCGWGACLITPPWQGGWRTSHQDELEVVALRKDMAASHRLGVTCKVKRGVEVLLTMIEEEFKDRPLSHMVGTAIVCGEHLKEFEQWVRELQQQLSLGRALLYCQRCRFRRSPTWGDGITFAGCCGLTVCTRYNRFDVWDTSLIEPSAGVTSP